MRRPALPSQDTYSSRSWGVLDVQEKTNICQNQSEKLSKTSKHKVKIINLISTELRASQHQLGLALLYCRHDGENMSIYVLVRAHHVGRVGDRKTSLKALSTEEDESFKSYGSPSVFGRRAQPAPKLSLSRHKLCKRKIFTAAVDTAAPSLADLVYLPVVLC